MSVYSGHGVCFEYPEIWEITEQQVGDDTLLTVESEGTTFWTLRIIPDCPVPPQAVQSCVDGFEEEYDDVEVEQIDCTLAGIPAVARDLSFTYIELLNTAGLRSVRTVNATLLVYWQGTDMELDDFQPVLDRMTSSVQVQNQEPSAALQNP